MGEYMKKFERKLYVELSTLLVNPMMQGQGIGSRELSTLLVNPMMQGQGIGSRELSSLLVNPMMQGQGIGSRFFNFVYEKHRGFTGTESFPATGFALASLPDKAEFWKKRKLEEVDGKTTPGLIMMVRDFEEK